MLQHTTAHVLKEGEVPQRSFHFIGVKEQPGAAHEECHQSICPSLPVGGSRELVPPMT